MTDFMPELGQMCFSNTEWQAMEMQPHVEQALVTLGELIEQFAPKDEYGQACDPMSNSGTEFSCPVFTARSYCWCDGERHPDGCPPNFEWRDFKACWYKHVRRGNSQSREMGEEECKEMLRECSAALLATPAPGGKGEGRLLTTLADVLEQATGEDSQAISAFRDGFLLLAEHGLFHVRTHVHRRVTGEYDREKLRALADGGGEGEGR